MSHDRERLERVFGGPELAKLRARLRRRLARGIRLPKLTLANLTTREREVLTGLIGRRARDAISISIPFAELDEAIARAGLAHSLIHALELLDGPIVDFAAERERLENHWTRAFDECTEPRLRALFQLAANRGLVKRLATDPAAGRVLLVAAAAVLARLPAVPGVTRSQIAADVLGDAHALDAGRPIGTLVLAALGPLPAERTRETWARAGVMINELAKPALVLNLTAASGCSSAAGILATTAAVRGEPLHLSLRALLRQNVRWDVRGTDVFVCENANLLAIVASRLGARSAPLVCTDGMPSASQRTLLSQLADNGARLRYHGDFDWPGVRIGNYVVRTFGATAWRFDAGHYRARAGKPLRGMPVEASWDVNLRPAMVAGGAVLEEEAEEIVADLLDDLERAATRY